MCIPQHYCSVLLGFEIYKYTTLGNLFSLTVFVRVMHSRSLLYRVALCACTTNLQFYSPFCFQIFVVMSNSAMNSLTHFPDAHVPKFNMRVSTDGCRCQFNTNKSTQFGAQWRGELFSANSSIFKNWVTGEKIFVNTALESILEGDEN